MTDLNFSHTKKIVYAKLHQTHLDVNTKIHDLMAEEKKLRLKARQQQKAFDLWLEKNELQLNILSLMTGDIPCLGGFNVREASLVPYGLDTDNPRLVISGGLYNAPGLFSEDFIGYYLWEINGAPITLKEPYLRKPNLVYLLINARVTGHSIPTT